MNELIDKGLQYVWGVWRFRWLALLLAWLLALSGWIVVENLQDQYVATARIQVDSNRILKPLMQGIAIQPDVNERVTLMSKSVLSRPNLQKLMETSGLGGTAQTEAELEQELNQLQNTLYLSGTHGNNSIYNVWYKHFDPQTAKRIVESVITLFVETNLGEERQDSSRAHAFLDKQLEEYESRLKDAEERRSAFRRRNAGKMPGEAGNYFQRYEAALEKQRVAEVLLRKALNRRTELNRQIAGESPGTRQFDSIWQNPINQKIRTYQDELNSLLVQYTDRHPRVAQLREAISELESQRQQYAGSNPRSSDENLLANPVYQEMRSLLSETEAGIAELRVEVSENNQQVNILRGTIDSIPEIEAEYQQLDRDYVTLKDQHGALVVRRESARMSERVEQNVDDIKFKVIDPPFVPSKPEEPNKLILNAFVLVMSIGAGVGLSLLLSLIKPIYFNQLNLGQVTGLPVLGSVMMITKPVRRARIWMGRFVFSSLAVTLLVTFCGLSYLRISGNHVEVYKRLQSIEVVKNVKDSNLAGAIKNSSLLKRIEEITAGQI